MCTSLTLETNDGHHLFARTMDFTLDFDQKAMVVPRQYTWKNVSGETVIAKQAVAGMGIEHQDQAILADGLNEAGMSCAALYFPGFACYSPNRDLHKTNLAPFEFVLWSLSQFDSVQSVKEEIDCVSFLDFPLSLLKTTPPLHWILSDKSGACMVIESTKQGVRVYDNPVGVMTNSPEFSWHLQNLRQYIGLRPGQFEPTQWGSLPLNAFGQGSGSVGLPGDFTPPSRFVRAAYWKQNIRAVENEGEGLTAVFHILSSCEIPKGGVTTLDNLEDHTIYTSAMCAESGTYYYHTYDCSQISAIRLSHENPDADRIKMYPFHRVQSVHDEN